MQAELRREALRLAEEFKEANRAALLNLLSDSTAAVTLFAMLLRNTEGRVALFSTFGRVVSGLSDTAKAFLIIASAGPRPGCLRVSAACVRMQQTAPDPQALISCWAIIRRRAGRPPSI